MVNADSIHFCSNCGYQTDDSEVIGNGVCPECDFELSVREND